MMTCPTCGEEWGADHTCPMKYQPDRVKIAAVMKLCKDAPRIPYTTPCVAVADILEALGLPDLFGDSADTL
jgi:hypothetical protein